MEMSTSLYLPSSAMHRLNTEPGLFDVWASTSGPPGAVLSSTTFQTLPSALPVTPDFHPGGSSPTLALSKLSRVGVGPPAQALVEKAATTSRDTTCMVQPPGSWQAEALEGQTLRPRQPPRAPPRCSGAQVSKATPCAPGNDKAD